MTILLPDKSLHHGETLPFHDGLVIGVHSSRGGTDSWANLVLACEECNRRKGEKTPDEAGISFVIRRRPQPPRSMRAQPYLWQTNAVLRDQLRLSRWSIRLSDTSISVDLDQLPIVIAKPISRGRRQVYTARNYPLSTPLIPGYVRVRTTIKRRTRVNVGIVVQHTVGRSKIHVITEEKVRKDPNIIRIGALCTVMRAGKPVTGIVAAVQSNGRLSLLTLQKADQMRIRWHRVIVSPGRGLQVLSRDRVLFFDINQTSE